MALRRRRTEIPTSSEVAMLMPRWSADSSPPSSTRRRRGHSPQPEVTPAEGNGHHRTGSCGNVMGFDRENVVEDGTEPPSRRRRRIGLETYAFTARSSNDGNNDSEPEIGDSFEPEMTMDYRRLVSPRRALRSTRTRTPTPRHAVPVNRLTRMSTFNTSTVNLTSRNSVITTESMSVSNTEPITGNLDDTGRFSGTDNLLVSSPGSGTERRSEELNVSAAGGTVADPTGVDDSYYSNTANENRIERDVESRAHRNEPPAAAEEEEDEEEGVSENEGLGTVPGRSTTNWRFFTSGIMNIISARGRRGSVDNEAPSEDGNLEHVNHGGDGSRSEENIEGSVDEPSSSRGNLGSDPLILRRGSLHGEETDLHTVADMDRPVTRSMTTADTAEISASAETPAENEREGSSRSSAHNNDDDPTHNDPTGLDVEDDDRRSAVESFAPTENASTMVHPPESPATSSDNIDEDVDPHRAVTRSMTRAAEAEGIPAESLLSSPATSNLTEENVEMLDREEDLEPIDKPELSSGSATSRDEPMDTGVTTTDDGVAEAEELEVDEASAGNKPETRDIGIIVPEEQPRWRAGHSIFDETVVIGPHRRNDREASRPEPRPRPQPQPDPEPEPETSPAVPPPQPEEGPSGGDTEIDDVTPPAAEDLKFVKLDLLKKSNRFMHKTDEYEPKSGPESALIIRRGWKFKVTVSVSDTYNKETDVIILKFLKSGEPLYSRKTLIFIATDQSEESYMSQGWSLDITDVKDKDVELEVSTPVDASVGKWTIVVETHRTKADGSVQISRRKPAEMTVLFNAFHKDDDVYVKDDDERNEYIMNDSGYIYTMIDGYYVGSRAWNFGQFEKDVLNCAVELLDRDRHLAWRQYGNPVEVCRTLTAQVNSSDDAGILTGNWSGDYEGGASPTSWNGSVKIIQQYYDTKKPVKFGQCWVFSGVLTTVSRALGIPTRSTTNNSSAHDTNLSNTIDHYIDEEGEPVKYKNSDSVWNFHVWNEAWMKRQDLPPGYDGWQAFDATPQETSGGRYACGPCPLSAIYKGEVHMRYDGDFIFSEVNADRVYWKKKPGVEEYVVYSIKESAVGKDISTKKVLKKGDPEFRNGKAAREDVTNMYKPKEGSREERVTVMKAMRRDEENWNKMVASYEDYRKNKLDVDYEAQATTNTHGEFNAKFVIKNTSSEERVVKGKINMLASYNVGPAREKLMAPLMVEKTIAAGGEDTVEWRVPAEEYYSKLNDDCDIQVCAAFRVKDSDQTWSWIENIAIQKPDIDVELNKKEVKVGEEFEAKVEFKNPIQVDIHHVEMGIEGAGIEGDERELKVDDTLPKGGSIRKTVKLRAQRPGRRVVIVSFDGRELQGINGTATIVVKGDDSE